MFVEVTLRQTNIETEKRPLYRSLSSFETSAGSMLVWWSVSVVAIGPGLQLLLFTPPAAGNQPRPWHVVGLAS